MLAFGTLELKTNWGELYGELGKGTYRIVKDASGMGGKYFSVEFTID